MIYNFLNLIFLDNFIVFYLLLVKLIIINLNLIFDYLLVIIKQFEIINIV